MRLIARALDHLLRATGDPLSDLVGIGPDHPDHVQAAVIRAAVGVLAKVPDTLPDVARAIHAAESSQLSRHWRAHLEAAQLWVQGDAHAAARRYADIVRSAPRDLLALRLAVSCYFFLSEPEHSCTLIDEILPQWQPEDPGFGFIQAMASFVHAETGHAERAEQLGRDALALDPSCPMGVHAVAHALAQAGRPGRGARWMRAQRAHWAVPSRMRTHNAWHLAMFDVDDGHVAPALGILDTCLLPAAHTSPIDACDASTLVWRLAAGGLEVGSRWQSLSEAFHRRWRPGFWPYVDLHAAITHLRANQVARLERLARGVEHYAAASHPGALRTRRITLPVVQALELWGLGDPQSALRALRSLRPALTAAGGSRLQTEIFRSLEQGAAPAPRAASQTLWRRSQVSLRTPASLQ
jgi:hypothetical protein